MTLLQRLALAGLIFIVFALAGVGNWYTNQSGYVHHPTPINLHQALGGK